MEKYIPPTYTQAENDVKLEQYCNAVSYRLNNLESPSDVDCKRWPWELVQNAKDTIVNNETLKYVDVEFDYYEENGTEIVKFSHNGGHFSEKAVSGLIWKFSAEKRDEFYTEDGVARDKQSTGRFGTGFLTTHTLSKRVKIGGVMFDPNKGRNISVDFTLYREGDNDDELKKGVQRTTEELEFDGRLLLGNEKTEFSYILRNDINKKAARLGIEEIKSNGVLTMLFCPTVNSIHLNDKGQITQIKRLSEASIPSCHGMSRVVFEVYRPGYDAPQYRYFIIVSKEAHSDVLTEYFNKERNLRLQVAIEVTKDNQLIDQDYRTTPSVFCSLPLTGFEGFTLPYYVNSNDFEPTGERMSIYLRKNRDGEEYDEKTGKNKHKYYNSGINWYILEESIRLFEEIVDYASANKFRNLYSFANGLNIDLSNATWGEVVNMDALASRLIIPLRNLISDKRLVEGQDGNELRQPKLLRFPRQKKDKEDANYIFYGLCSEYYGKIVPKQDISNEWEKRAWKKFNKWSDDFDEKVENESFPTIQVIDLIKDVESNGSVSSLPSTIVSKFGWLNRLYDLLSEDKVKMEEHAIIPNRNGMFKTFDNESLHDGRQIPSAIFNFMKSYGIDWDDKLVNDEVRGISFGKIITIEEVSIAINEQSVAFIDEASKQPNIDLFAKLFLLFKRTPGERVLNDNRIKHQTLFSFIGTAFKTKCSEFSNYGGGALDVHFKAWDKVNEWFAKLLVSEIAKKGHMDVEANNTTDSVDNVSLYCSVEWLSDVVNFMLANQYITTSDLSKDGLFIIPNRKGDFCAYKDLKGIGEIPEALLSAELENIGVKLNEDLIHPDFYFADNNNYPSKESLSSVVSSINEFFNQKTDETATSLEAAQFILFLDNPVLSSTNISRLRDLYIELKGLPDIHTLAVSTTDLSLWQGATRFIENHLISSVESYKNVEELALSFRPDAEDDASESQDENATTEEKDFAFDWLNRFISYLNSQNIPLENRKIAPNYHEEFVAYNAQTLYRSDCIKNYPQNQILIEILESELARCTLWPEHLVYENNLIQNIVHPRLNGLTTQGGLYSKLNDCVDYLIDYNFEEKNHLDLLKPIVESLLNYFDSEKAFIEREDYFAKTYKRRNDIAMDLIYDQDTRNRLQQLHAKFTSEELDQLIEKKEIITEILNNNISLREIEKICSFRGFDSLKQILSEFPDFDFEDLLERLRTQGDFDTRKINYEIENERKREIGDKGEAFVYQELLLQFAQEQIIWSNLCKDDECSDRCTQMKGISYRLKTTSHDYDFKVQTGSSTIYIEVKSTVGCLERSKDFPLFFETKEWRHLENDEVNSDDIHLVARVFDVENNPSVYYLRQTTLV